MQRTDWIDVILLLTIGVVFQTIISWFSHVNLDFALAVLFLILVIKRDQRMIWVSIGVVAIISALTSSGESVFEMSLLEKILTGGTLYLVVRQTRSYFTDEIFQLCVIGVLGTILHGCFLSLLSLFGTGASLWGFVQILMQAILPATLLNVGVAYVLYVTLQHGEQIRKARYSECS